MSKTFILGFVVGVGLLTVAGVGASRLRQKDAEQAKHRAEIAEYQADLLDATPVQLGVSTDEQRSYSKLYTYYQQLTKSTPVSTLVAEAKSKSVGIEVHVGLGPVRDQPETPENYFGNLTKDSDAVIRGRVTKKVSHITEDDAFIFSNYDVVVTEVLKSNISAPLEVGTTIVLTRPGGKVLVNGIIVKATDHSFAPLPSMGQEVVLFMKFIPETGSYRANGPTASFALEDQSIRPLTGVEFPPGVLRDSESLLRAARVLSKADKD